MSRISNKNTSASGQAIGQLIEQRTSTARAMLDRADWLYRIQTTLRTELGTPWAASLRVANIRANTLVLFSDNASTALRARLSAPQILKLINQQYGLQCENVDARTRPDPRDP